MSEVSEHCITEVQTVLHYRGPEYPVMFVAGACGASYEAVLLLCKCPVHCSACGASYGVVNKYICTSLQTCSIPVSFVAEQTAEVPCYTVQ